MIRDYSTPKKIATMLAYSEPKLSAAPAYAAAEKVVKEVRAKWYFLQDRLKEFSEKRDKLQGEIIHLQDESMAMLQTGGDPVELSQPLHDKKVELADVDDWIKEIGEKIEAMRPERAKAEKDRDDAWDVAVRQEIVPKYQEEKMGFLAAASETDSSFFKMVKKLFRKMRLDGRTEDDWPSKKVPSAISYPMPVDMTRSGYRTRGTWGGN